MARELSRGLRIMVVRGLLLLAHDPRSRATLHGALMAHDPFEAVSEAVSEGAVVMSESE